MLYNFLTSLAETYPAFFVFNFLTFRTGLALGTSLTIAFIIGGPLIKIFSKNQITGNKLIFKQMCKSCQNKRAYTHIYSLPTLRDCFRIFFPDTDGYSINIVFFKEKPGRSEAKGIFKVTGLLNCSKKMRFKVPYYY